MAANKTLNLWMASSVAERNSLGSAVGLAVGDFCVVDGLGISVAATVTATASTWRAIAAIPTVGHVALGGKNTADMAISCRAAATSCGRWPEHQARTW